MKLRKETNMNRLQHATVCLSKIIIFLTTVATISMQHGSCDAYSFVILGGTGRIGTAVASHLLNISKGKDVEIILVGRNEAKGQAAVKEVLNDNGYNGNYNLDATSSVKWKLLNDCWDLKDKTLGTLLVEADCVIHTAGPYLGEEPVPLTTLLNIAKSSSDGDFRCKAYVDVSDPLDYLEKSICMDHVAKDTGVSALVASGAFPGMSNILATDAAHTIIQNGNEDDDEVKDVRFNYFTAGLGGSGDVNLFITNIGFGEAMNQYANGSLKSFRDLSGKLLGKVSFFLENDPSSIEAQRRVGTQTVFSWPFPEAATVPRNLSAKGDSHAAMGTAPDLWNLMLGVLVTLIPRHWWSNAQFSQFLADFSNPLVKLTDTCLRLTSDSVGETHAMRIDVTSTKGKVVSAIQGHESFRRCVGQSCAEFAMDLLKHPNNPGVYLPEQRYRDVEPRQRILDRLSILPGTFCYTGPKLIQNNCQYDPKPTNLEKIMSEIQQ